MAHLPKHPRKRAADRLTRLNWVANRSKNIRFANSLGWTFRAAHAEFGSPAVSPRRNCSKHAVWGYMSAARLLYNGPRDRPRDTGFPRTCAQGARGGGTAPRLSCRVHPHFDHSEAFSA